MRYQPVVLRADIVDDGKIKLAHDVYSLCCMIIRRKDDQHE
jgi:hypothetical protein